MTNCVNCGAILIGNVCEYCGTRYTKNKIDIDIETNRYTGELKIGNKIFNVYLADVEEVPIMGRKYRDAYGIEHCKEATLKHKFQLIEI